MAITIESSNTASSSSSDTVTITKPTGLAVDDLMVAVIYAHDTSSAPTLATPSGWTLAGGEADALSGTDKHEFAMFYKLAESADVAASNFSFTAGSTMDYMDGVMLRVSSIRTDVAALGAFSKETRTDVDNPTYTVSLAPAQNNVLYVATFISGDVAYTATDVTITGTNPTWTRYLNAGHTVDATAAVQVFASVDASPESSITSLAPTETGSDSGTDSVGAIAFFLGQNDGSATLTLTETSNTAFAPSVSAGANLTIGAITETSQTKAADPTGFANSPTQWTNKTKPSTNWANKIKP